MAFSFLRKWRDRRAENPVRIAAESEPPHDDDMEWFFPPRDVHDCSAWDRYWNDQVAPGLPPPAFDMFCDDEQLIKTLLARSAKTVLCAGNGISQEPRALTGQDSRRQRWIPRERQYGSQKPSGSHFEVSKFLSS